MKDANDSSVLNAGSQLWLNLSLKISRLVFRQGNKSTSDAWKSVEWVLNEEETKRALENTSSDQDYRAILFSGKFDS